MSGPVVVGIRPTIPVEGVTLVLGNDLAGERVNPHLSKVTDNDSVPEPVGRSERSVSLTRHLRTMSVNP